MLHRFFIFFATFFIVLAVQEVHAQCGTAINAFPYSETFEANNGNWTKSATLHWEWGTIVPGTKSVITAAGGGQKCWIVGGLSGKIYNGGLSYLQSPCFDFTNLSNPEISFKVFWETEQSYDGANLQYSIDQGATWLIVGSATSNSNCLATNWYNSSSVRFIGNTAGWSGSVQPGSGNCGSGGGSGQWLTAKHNLNLLAGKNKVIFRFAFGAGTVCNDYEGFAIDDVVIRQTPPASADFTYSCLGNNAVSFANVASLCQTGVSWNFGDPASGSANASTQTNPTHTFSAPGTYSVTLTVTYSNGSPSAITKTIVILGANSVITQPIRCHGDNNGSITVNVSGGNGTYFYNWNTNPAQNTSTISNLSAGTYTVNVSAIGACSTSSSITLVEPNAINIQAQINPETCQSHNGSIQTTVTGGTNAYAYTWSNSESTASIIGLAAGNYSLLVTDANGCSATSNNLQVTNINVPVQFSLGNDTTICTGETLLLSPGAFQQYLWQDNSAAPTYMATTSGNYFVEVTNAAGCKGSDTIQVTVQCVGIYFPSSFTPNADGLNDGFGPVGDLATLRDYRLYVYNRWGQLVFASYNPYEKWNGGFKSMKQEMGSFVWISSYRIAGGSKISKKGTLTILR